MSCCDSRSVRVTGGFLITSIDNTISIKGLGKKKHFKVLESVLDFFCVAHRETIYISMGLFTIVAY